MTKGALILGISSLAVGLAICFIGPKIYSDPTVICLIGSVICFAGTQTIAKVIVEKQYDKENDNK